MPAIELTLNQIICGDNCEVMRTLPSDSIDLVVTSPPYDNLRTYSAGKPMSELWDFEGVAQQLWRIIKPGGVVVWVVSDATVDGSETGTSFRQALRFMDIGFRLHDTMIWEKVDPKPGDGKVRYHDAWEYMFVLSNGRPSTCSLLRDVPSLNAGSKYTKNWDRRRNEKAEGVDRKEWIQPKFSYRRNIWKTLHGGNQPDLVALRHPACFPEALARDHILSWSNEGDIVLDPFAGSFTTCKMAKLMGRKWIGIEVNPEYCEIGKDRMAQQVLF